MKRLLALLLCLTCLMGALVSCNNDTEPTPPAETTPAPSEPSEPSEPSDPSDPSDPTDPSDPSDPAGPSGDGTVVTEHILADYTIVYPKDASATIKNAAIALAQNINTYYIGTGSIAAVADDQTVTTKHEILVGETNRAASAAYYAGESKAEFALRRAENTIVLAGFSDALAAMAVDYFAENYLVNATGGKIAAVTDYTLEPGNVLTLTSSSGSDVKIVYDATENYMSGISQTIASHLKTGIGTTLRRATAGTSFDASTVEIMVGSFDFSQIAAVKDALWLDGYAIAVIGNKLVISATTQADYEKAATAFGEMVAANTIKGQKKVVFLPDTFERVFSLDLLNNLPYVAGKPTAVYPGGDGAYIVVYEDVKANLFQKYLAALDADAAFEQYSRTDFDGNTSRQKNNFAMYVADQNTVNVGFHGVGYVGFGTQYVNGILYVTVTPTDGITLHNNKAPEYTPVDAEQYPMILVQLGLADFHPSSRSNCYIIRLADGTFIVHDSAFGSYDGQKAGDVIYQSLKKLAIDPNNIVISAWIHTHPHNDHVTGFVQFSNSYSTGKGVTVKQFIHNFADGSIWGADQTYMDNLSRAEKLYPTAEYVKPHAGNVLHFAGVKFNVIYTQEEYMALCQGATYFYHNASSLVLQMVTDDGTKVILPGDSPMTEQLYAAAGGSPAVRTYGTIWKWYGSFIESDILCYFHHGRNSGGTLEANQVIKPKVVLLPTTWGSLEEHATSTQAHAKYFMDDLTEGVLHTTPNANGVYGWYVAENGAQVVTFKNGDFTIDDYNSLSAFYAS